MACVVRCCCLLFVGGLFYSLFVFDLCGCLLFVASLLACVDCRVLVVVCCLLLGVHVCMLVVVRVSCFLFGMSLLFVCC